jgi:hypothetical protein
MGHRWALKDPSFQPRCLLLPLHPVLSCTVWLEDPLPLPSLGYSPVFGVVGLTRADVVVAGGAEGGGHWWDEVRSDLEALVKEEGQVGG